MTDHYDRLENRAMTARETALFRDLRHVLAVSRSRAPALRAQIKGIDPATLQTRADLARVPLRRAADLVALQNDAPPFGGLAAARLGALCHVFAWPGTPASASGPAKDWWGMGRVLFAAGLRKGMLLLNCFEYNLSPFGHMVETGARAIGCPVVPAGSADLDRKLDVVTRLKPRFFCGTVAHLRELLDRAAVRGTDTSCLGAALAADFSNWGTRSALHLLGIEVRHALVLPDLGPVAYESSAGGGLIVNEGLIVEIIDPVTALPVPEGQEGELVVTRINPDYPLLRYATGLWSARLATPSVCGRTNMRIATPRTMTPAFVRFGNACVDIEKILEIAARHPEVGRMRVVTRRPGDHDELVLKVEHDGDEPTIHERLCKTLHLVTRIAGTVELVRPGTFADDDDMIVDERPLN